MAEVWTNFAVSTLASTITTGTTGIDLEDAAAFPSPTGGDYFWAVIVEGSTVEVVKCTARSGNLVTVVRAQGGTTASAFSAGALFSHRVVAETLEDLQAGGGGGGAVGRSFKAGQYYGNAGLTTGIALVDEILTAHPFEVYASQSFDRIGIFCTVQSAGSTLRLGIYGDSAGYPAALVVDAGTVDTASGSGWVEATISETLAAGVYWLAALTENGTPTTRCFQSNNTQLPQVPFDTSSSAGFHGWYKTGVADGALPDPFPAGAVIQSTRITRIGLRAS